PAGDVLDRHQQPVCLHQPVKDVLQNVFRITGLGHTPADEVQQERPLALDDFPDALVLFECHALNCQVLRTGCFAHPLMKTNEATEYCSSVGTGCGWMCSRPVRDD